MLVLRRGEASPQAGVVAWKTKEGVKPRGKKRKSVVAIIRVLSVLLIEIGHVSMALTFKKKGLLP